MRRRALDRPVMGRRFMLPGRSAAGLVVLLWPASSPTFRLLQNTVLTTTNRVSNTNSISVVNGTNQVTISPATGNLFFRLINP